MVGWGGRGGGARTCPHEKSVKFCDFAELMSLIALKTFVVAVLTDFRQMVPVKSSWGGALRDDPNNGCDRD